MYTCRLSDDDDAREVINVFMRTVIISLRVFGVLATIVFHTCKAACEEKHEGGSTSYNTYQAEPDLCYVSLEKVSSKSMLDYLTH